MKTPKGHFEINWPLVTQFHQTKIICTAFFQYVQKIFYGRIEKYCKFGKASKKCCLVDIFTSSSLKKLDAYVWKLNNFMKTWLFLQPPAQSPKEDQEDHVFLIQTVLDKAMKKDGLVNELFLQLIKQTTDHPEPNSR